VDINADPLSSQHNECLNTIKTAAQELGIDFQTSTCPRYTDFAQRYSPDDTLLISVHTVGVARNVVRLKESYLPGIYYFDRSGYSGWAELAYNTCLQKEAVNYHPESSPFFVEKIRSEKCRLNTSKYKQPNPEGELQLNTLGNDSYILLPLQTSDDVVARLSSVNQLSLAEALADIAQKINVPLVIKRHPFCNDHKVESVIERLQKDYKGVYVSSCSINSLIAGAKGVVTVNSGVGFEALVMGVPVITAGRSDYSFVTHNISKIEDLPLLPDMLNINNLSKINNMINFFVNEYCLDCGNIKKAIKFLNKWASEDYACMENMHGYKEYVLNDIQNYIGQLEKIRRDKCLSKTELSFYEKMKKILKC